MSIALGVGLAAATGFRVFLPMLVASVAAYSGSLPLGDGFAWLGTPAAMLMLGVAALLEVGAYFVPGVDNLLDVIAAPVAVIAGAIVSAATMADLPPMMKWTAAIVAGGGAAGIVHGVTAALRAKSTVLTAGLGNSTRCDRRIGRCAPRIASCLGCAGCRLRDRRSDALAGDTVDPAPAQVSSSHGCSGMIA
ncbi:DUF4126 domain-containing protein [Bradyrhizobium japonicum]|uniref:DUF4126 domain-containing protein n=1 Tax=Bradyrhizobium japonicum TaxID=375 RepID=UPI003F490FDC